MREKVIYSAAMLGTVLLLRNLYIIFLQLPDEAEQGAIYRIMFFHIPAAFTAFTLFFAALLASIGYLWKRSFRYDSFAVAATELGLMFATINLVTGSIWGRNVWGIWWTWDARLTTMLLCWLLYAGYLILRPSIQEPSQRATLSAALSIFAFADVPIVWYSIEWWRTQHPAPVLRGSGLMDPLMKQTLYLNWLAIMLIAVAFLLVRLRQEQISRELDALRREAHAI